MQLDDLKFKRNPECRKQLCAGLWDNGFDISIYYRERDSRSHKYCMVIKPPEEMNRGVLTRLNITAEQANGLMKRTAQNRWEESDFPELDTEQD